MNKLNKGENDGSAKQEIIIAANEFIGPG